LRASQSTGEDSTDLNSCLSSKTQQALKKGERHLQGYLEAITGVELPKYRADG